MRGFRVLELVVFAYLAFLGVRVFEKPKEVVLPVRKTWLLVYADGRYWRLNPDGFLIGTAGDSDLGRYTVVMGVELDGLKISDSDLEKLRHLDILNDPFLSVLNVSERYVITVKGIVLYFQGWDDLNEYFEEIKDEIVYASPRSRYFLYEGGRLVILRGD